MDFLRIPTWESVCKMLTIPYTKRSTGVVVILCPYHKEKTPSLHMWPESHNFRCHGCHAHGTIGKFLRDFAPSEAFTDEKLLLEIWRANQQDARQLTLDLPQT